MGRFSDLIDTPKTVESEIKQNSFATQDVTPELAAESIDLSKKFNTTPELVTGSIDEFRKKDAELNAVDLKSLAIDAPKTVSWIASDPSRTALTKSGLPKIKSIEDSINQRGYFSKLYSVINKSWNQTLAGVANFPVVVGDTVNEIAKPLYDVMGIEATPTKKLIESPGGFQGFGEIKDYFQNIADVEAERSKGSDVDSLDALGNAWDFIKQGEFSKASEQVANLSLGVAEASFGSGALAAVAALSGGLTLANSAMFVSSSGSKYDELNQTELKEAVPTSTKLLRAGMQGAIDTATENMFGTISSFKKSSKTIIKSLEKAAGKDGAKQIVGEVFKRMGSSFIEEGVLEEGTAGITGSMLDYLMGTKDDMTFKGELTSWADGMIKGGLGGMAMTTPSAAGYAVLRNQQIKQQERSAKLNRDALLKVGVNLSESGLKELSPESAKELVNEQAKGSGMETVYIPRSRFDAYFQENNEDPSQAAAKLNVIESYDEAKDSGLIKISLGDWASKVVGTPAEKGLSNDIKYDLDSLTVNEAQEQKQALGAELEEVNKKAEEVLKQKQDYRTLEKEIEANLVEQGIAAGRAAKDQAMFFANRAKYRAETVYGGISPLELYRKEGLKIIGYDVAPEGMQGFEQSSVVKTDTPEFKAWFGESKAVDESGAPKVFYHGTGTSFESFDPAKNEEQKNWLAGDGLISGFFTEKADFANDFAAAVNGETSVPRQYRQGAQVVPVYLQTQNPFDYQNPTHVDALVNKLYGEGPYKGVVGENVSDLKEGAWQQLERPKVISAIKELGFDSIFVNERGSKNIAVFSPTQIKSVNNRGTFDPNDPRILYQEDAQSVAQVINSAPKKKQSKKVKAAIALIKEAKKDPNKIILFNSSTAKDAKDIEAIGIVPQHGSWIKEVTESTGAVGEDQTAEDFLKENDVPELAYFSEKPDWIFAQIARVLGKKEGGFWKDYDSFKRDDVSKNAQLSVVIVEKDNTGDFKRVAQGGEYFESLDGTEKTQDIGNAIGPESGDIVSDQTQYPDIVLKGEDVIQFLKEEYADILEDFNKDRENKILFQSDKKKVKGFFDPVQKLIGIIRGEADPSTLFHEQAGHVYLEEMKVDYNYLKNQAELTAAQERYIQNADVILEYLGVKSFDEIKRPQHELFSRTVEGYILEGKFPESAPQKLKSALKQFTEWLVGIYRDIKGLEQKAGFKVNIDEKLRGALDQMLLGVDAVKKASREYEDLPAIEESLNKKDADEYFMAKEAAINAANEQVTRPMVDDYMKKQQELYKKEAQSVREKLLTELEKDPSQQMLKSLKEDEKIKAMPKEIQAEVFGFKNNVAEFDAAIKRAERARTVGLDAAVQAEMDKRYPNKLLDLEEAAIEAVNNTYRTKKLRLEAKFIAEQAGGLDKKLTAKLIERMPNDKIVKEEAARQIRNKKITEIKPYIYERAERAASKEAARAFKKKDFESAFEAKRKELLNHELYKQAFAAQKNIEKKVKDYKKFNKADAKLSERRDVDYINAARSVLAEFGLGRSDKSPQEYLSGLRKYDPQRYSSLLNIVSKATEGSEYYKDTTYKKFEQMTNVVDALWNLSRSEEMMTVQGEKVELSKAAGELIIQGNAAYKTRENKEQYSSTKAKHGKFATNILRSKAALTRIEHWVDFLDRGNINGPFRKYLWNPIYQSQVEFDLKKDIVLDKYRSLIKEYQKNLKDSGPIAATKDELVTEGKPFEFENKFELIMAILHTGNKSNLSKLLRGYEWGAETNGVLDTSNWDNFIDRMIKEEVLVKEDFDFAQEVWDLMDSFKADTQKTHKELHGYYFEEISAQEFTNKFGTYRGGYIPAKVDVKNVVDSRLLEEIDTFEKNNVTLAFPTTSEGATMSRNEAFAKRLSLDMNLLGTHIDWALRYTYLQPAVKDVSRLLNTPEMQAEINRIDPDMKEALKEWLTRTAQQSTVTPQAGQYAKSIANTASFLRSSGAMTTMFLNVPNTLQQLTGMIVAMNKVKPRFIRGAIVDYIKASGKTNELTKEVVERSEYMQTRLSSNVFEIQGEINDLLATPSKYESVVNWAKKHTYVLQGITQGVVDVTVWKGAYEQYIAEGKSEPEAIAFADSAVRLTQGSNKAIDISGAEVGSPLYKVFVQFAGYFNMLLNLNGYEAMKVLEDTGAKKGGGRLFAIYMTSFMIPAFLSDMIMAAMSGRGIDEDDDEEYLDDLLFMFGMSQFKTTVATAPVVGQAANAAANRLFTDNIYDDRLNMSLAVSTADKLISVPKNIYDLIQKENVSAGKATKDTLELIGLLTHTPLGPLAKPIKYSLDVSEGNTTPDGVLDFGRGLITGKGERR